MAASPRLSQIFNNQPCAAQYGGGTIVKGKATMSGGPALISVAASGYCSSERVIEAALTLNGAVVVEPSLFATQGNTHFALLPAQQTVDLAAGSVAVALVAANKATFTDQNDRCSVSMLQLGGDPPLARVRAVRNGKVPPSEELPNCPFETDGGTVLISVAATGSAEIAQMTGLDIAVDGVAVGSIQLFANRAGVPQAFVPANLVLNGLKAGEHQLELSPQRGTVVSFEQDCYSLTILEAATAPPTLQASQIFANAQCIGQKGGEEVVGATMFATRGGEALLRVGVSAYAGAPNQLLGVTIMIDHVCRAQLQLFANQASLHLCLVSNDFLLGELPAGNHTLQLFADPGTFTDFNDRCSVTILEVAGA